MNYLLLDTSQSKILVAIFKDSQLVFSFFEKPKKDMSSDIFLILKEAFLKANIKPNEINTIFVAVGPGSFTGVRIGVTIAKTYAWALKIKVVPISSLEIMASTLFNTKYIVPVIDARREAVYAGIYDDDLNIVLNDTYISLNDLYKKLLEKNYVFCTYDDIVLQGNKIKPEIDLKKIISHHINDHGVNPHGLKPRYLKLTEAEENLRINCDKTA